jgi:eukaryotic-like serine/threonine-protein kinase
MPSALAMGPFAVGDVISGRFVVRGLLGRGGHAFVYHCFNKFLEEDVAIKVIPNPPNRGQQLFKRARGEAQFLYRLNHPNVVRVMEGFEVEGMACIVMEKLSGSTLRDVLRMVGSLTILEALNIALQIAEGLAAAHAVQVIHRDLKPENIFLVSGGELIIDTRLIPDGQPMVGNYVKVFDFGIAKNLEGGYQTTEKDLIQGTAPYMSPEQGQGFGVTARSDIFQLGVILYEMIAGLCPCLVGVDEQPSVQVMIAMQIAKPPPRLQSIVQGVPADVDWLVWRALAKEPEDRFQSMAEFADMIRAAFARLVSELPAEVRHVRVLHGRGVKVAEPRMGSPAPSRAPVAARNTPVALVTSMPAPAAPKRQVSAPAPEPAKMRNRGAARKRLAAVPLFTGSVLIGIALALPIAVSIVMLRARQPSALAVNTSRLRQAADLPSVEKPSEVAPLSKRPAITTPAYPPEPPPPIAATPTLMPKVVQSASPKRPSAISATSTSRPRASVAGPANSLPTSGLDEAGRVPRRPTVNNTPSPSGAKPTGSTSTPTRLPKELIF